MDQRKRQLGVMLRLATEEEQQAGKRLALYNQELRRNEQQLQSLVDYKGSYYGRLSTHSQQTTASILNFYSFLEHLDGAITQQRQLLVQAKLQQQELQKNWQKKQQRVRMIEMIIQKMTHQQYLKAEKLEQQLLDEFSLRKPLE